MKIFGLHNYLGLENCLCGGNSFLASWGYNLDFIGFREHDDCGSFDFILPHVERIPTDEARDDTADNMYVGGRKEIASALREYPRFAPYATFLENKDTESLGKIGGSF